MFFDPRRLPCLARRLLAAALGTVCLFGPLHALAHKGSDAYLVVGTAPDGRASLRLSVALKDLDVVLPIDTDQDGQVTWGEVRAAAPVVAAHLGQVLQGSGAEASDTCSPDWSAQGLERRSDGAYWVAGAVWPCGTDQLRMTYRLMEEVDRSHRLLVSGQWGGQPVLATVAPGAVLDLGGPASAPVAQSPAGTVWNYLGTGAAHLLEGYDHMAFLLALVLPLYLPLRRPLQPLHVRPLQLAVRSSDWLRMFSTVTAFTLGHSVTLGLVAMGWLRVSSDWVEPAIVLSIGISALLNLYPVRWLRTDVLAGVFGLVHGMGFAGLLLDAQAPQSLLPWALLGFNLGIEGAQLLILLVWVLACQPLLAKPWYTTRFVRGLSSALVAFSAILLSRFAV